MILGLNTFVILFVKKFYQEQQQLPLLSHGCIQQQQTTYYRQIHLWGLRR